MPSLSVPRPDKPTATNHRRWWGLTVLAVAQLMLLVDTTVVNLALAPIQQDLHFTHLGLSWVINGYTLPFGGLLLLGGRIADALGRRRVFLAGLALFAIASAIGGLAGSPLVLVLRRVLQGVGGALVAPAALSLVAVLFTGPSERASALSIGGCRPGSGALRAASLAEASWGICRGDGSSSSACRSPLLPSCSRPAWCRRVVPLGEDVPILPAPYW